MADWITTSVIPCVFVYEQLCIPVCIKVLYVCALPMLQLQLQSYPLVHRHLVEATYSLCTSLLSLSLSPASLSTLHADEDGQLPYYDNKFIFWAYDGAEFISVLTTFFPNAS